jgi:hypothetical protein
MLAGGWRLPAVLAPELKSVTQIEELDYMNGASDVLMSGVEQEQANTGG